MRVTLFIWKEQSQAFVIYTEQTPNLQDIT